MFEDAFLLNIVLVAAAIALSGPIALILILVQRSRIATLEGRLAQFERILARSPVAPAAAAPPPPEPRAPEAEPAPPPPAAIPTPPATAAQPASVPPVRPPAAPAARRPSFEERFGTRWTVWIGGVALAFGAILLVRYSVEAGLFGPGLRIASAFALAFGMLCLGEALRRRMGEARKLPLWPDIPATVTAAGTAALFGAIYAAHALYGFIGPEIAFAALGATGIATMVAALLHGPSLAGLGLVGSLGTPLLVGSAGGGTWPLTLYLPLVAASAYGFAWLKGWRALAVAAGIGVGAWALLLAITAAGASATAAALVHAALQAGLASIVLAVLPHRGGAGETARPDPFASGALALSALVLVMVLAVLSGGGADAVWIAAAIVAIGVPAVAGFLAPAAAAGLAVAGLATGAVVVLWPPEIGPDVTALPIWPETKDAGALVAVATLAAFGIAAAGAVRLLGGAGLPYLTAAIYAGSATLGPLLALALTYLRIAEGQASSPFAAAAGGLALAMTGVAALFRREGERTPSDGLRLGLGAFASAAVAGLALGLVFAISGGALTVAVALAALGTAAIARRLDIPALRWCVAGLGVLVAARLAYDPTVVGGDLGAIPILNWLLFGYGVPAVAFALASYLIRLPGRAPDAPVLIAEALALVFAAFLVFFEIRHALHGGDILADETGLLEQGLMALSALLFAIVLLRLDRVHGSPVIRIASLAFGALAFAQSLLALGLAVNPLLTDDPVSGGLVFNDIVLAYGMPTLAAAFLARAARETRPPWYVLSASSLAVVLGFIGLSLAIRHGFQGERLGLDRVTSQGEWYAYSAAWLALGLLLLAYGVLKGSLFARWASAALVGLSIVKVFLFDLAGLDGPLRALSFLGLGAVLIGIGLVYQRFVFAPDRGASERST